MTPRKAKQELKEILNQKTVRISRLKKVLSVLDYEQLERQYIQASQKINRQNKRLNYLESGRNAK